MIEFQCCVISAGAEGGGSPAREGGGLREGGEVYAEAEVGGVGGDGKEEGC